MKNLKSSRKNLSVASIASKVCAWTLSIMLVVTGMAPSFAADKAATKEGIGKAQTAVSNAFSSFYKNTKSSSKTPKKNFDKASLKHKAVESIKNEARNAKTPKEAKEKENKNGKQNKIKDKRGRIFNLNSSGNVHAKFDDKENLTVSAKNTSGDMNIEKDMWWLMAKKLGAGKSNWKDTQVKNISFSTNGIRLPENSEYFFNAVKGEINGCEKLNTSKVENMDSMFEKITSANPDVSKWEPARVTNTDSMFEGSKIKEADLSKWDVSKVIRSDNMFSKCENLEFIKTPEGLKTRVNGTNKNFKVVKMKKGMEAEIEHESINLNSEFNINDSGDKHTAYNIYRKDKYVGVTFDKNDADTSAFRNHEIVDKGKSIKDAKGELPEVKPKRTGYKFLGWAKSHKATAPDFDEDTIVRDDIVVYAVWREIVFPLNSKGDVKAKVGRDGDITISVVNSDGDRNIERRKWIDMVKETGGEDLDWKRSSFTGNIKVDSEVYLPEYCTYLFLGFKGNVIGADKFNTSKVINMRGMFSGATSANPDISNWDVSHVNHMREMFKGSGVKALNLTGWKLNQQLKTGNNRMQNMFEGCVNIEYLKTPKGLKTDISGANADFKIVRLKKDSAPSIEQENQNLNDNYEINKDGDSSAIYHIYDKNKYAGVIFDKNGGDKEAWMNHEITEKGKSIKESNGALPTENPNKNDHKFLGWSTDKDAGKPNFDEETVVNSDVIAYAVLHKDTAFDLNVSGNVKAKIDSDGNMTISAENPTGDINIDSAKWAEMVNALGGQNFAWSESFKGNMIIDSNVYLPQDCSYMFYNFKGKLIGADKFNTSKVTLMTAMFYLASSVNPDVLTWDTSNVTDMTIMFKNAVAANPDVSNWNTSKLSGAEQMFVYSAIKKADLSKWDVSALNNSDSMFFGCEGLEYLKTPKGFKTSVEKINKDFKVVKLKKGSEATVEHESKNLNSEFTINAEGDKEAAYNIYSKDTYVGVLFDKNDADTSAFRNHEITEKGKSLKDYKIGLPEVNPGRAGHKFLGWSKSKTATAPDFDESTVVDSDITAYAVWKKDTPPAPTKVTVTLDGNGGVLAGGASATIAVDKGSTVKEQLEAAVANNIFTKAGYRLIGFSKSKFATTADYDLDSPVYSDTTLYAVYEETHEVTTVTIKYTEVGMQE